MRPAAAFDAEYLRTTVVRRGEPLTIDRLPQRPSAKRAQVVSSHKSSSFPPEAPL